MDQIYSAANSASRAVFGDSAANSNRAGAPSTATDTAPQHTETNPFRSATTTAETSGLRHATDTGGSGTRHTAGSTQPTTTTTSMLEKPLVGDLNKDGKRYDTTDTDRPFGGAMRSEERPTISDTGIIPGTYPAQRPLEATGYQAHSTTREHSDQTHEHSGAQSHTPASAFPSTTGVSQKLGSGIPDTRDQTHEHQQFGSNLTGSGIRDQQQFGSNLHGQQLGSTTQQTHGPTDLPGTRDRAHEHQQLGSTEIPGTRDRTHEHQQLGSNLHGTHDQQLGSTTQHTHGSTDLPGTRDQTHEHQKFGSDLSGSGTRDQQQPGSNLHGTHGQHLGSTELPSTRDRTHEPGSDLAGTRDRSNLPSTSTSTSATKHQLPIGGHPTSALPHTTSTESGTGEKYERSTGVAADGGDFDASRPGAGREADRLLDERGIHHGADKKKDVGETEKGHPTLKRKDAAEGHSALKAVSGEHENKGEHRSTEEHKGLGEKIKEKLHLGHH